ncbi:MAG TPA: hypothetical protein VK615_17650 [Candidatus Binatia bacterium]|nr:hypothetical protein [Candidatus Binatia bacterium]
MRTAPEKVTPQPDLSAVRSDMVDFLKLIHALENYVTPAASIEPLRPIFEEMKLVIKALTAAAPGRAKELRDELSDGIVNGPCTAKTFRALEELTSSKAEHKIGFREQRRTIKLKRRTLEQKAEPFVREIFKGMRGPVQAFYDKHAAREAEFAELVAVKFEPSLSLQAVQHLLIWIDRMIKQPSSLNALHGLIDLA